MRPVPGPPGPALPAPVTLREAFCVIYDVPDATQRDVAGVFESERRARVFRDYAVSTFQRYDVERRLKVQQVWVLVAGDLIMTMVEAPLSWGVQPGWVQAPTRVKKKAKKKVRRSR